MPAAIQPAEVAQLRCPRCWFVGPFIPLASLTWRCVRCEWPFILSAPTVNSPAVPATTVNAANSTGTVVAVTISGGTLTSVVVNGSQAGTTAGTYLVPVGGTISITYSVAPTWAWALPTISAAVSAGGSALPFTSGGTAYSQGQVLIVDGPGTPDIVTVNGTPAAASVPVTTLANAHVSGVTVTVAQVTPALSGAGLENIPQTSY